MGTISVKYAIQVSLFCQIMNVDTPVQTSFQIADYALPTIPANNVKLTFNCIKLQISASQLSVTSITVSPVSATVFAYLVVEIFRFQPIKPSASLATHRTASPAQETTSAISVHLILHLLKEYAICVELTTAHLVITLTTNWLAKTAKQDTPWIQSTISATQIYAQFQTVWDVDSQTSVQLVPPIIP